jgi:hypothetical protein
MAIVINGSGTVTGLAVGGLPDGTVDSGTLATDSVTAAKIAADSVDSAELIDGAIDDSHMAAMAASKLTGALPAISAANLTSIPAANITGTLPAISGANLTNVGSMVKVASGNISSSTTNIDIDLSSYTSTYSLFKIVVRNWFADTGRLEVDKLTSSGTAANGGWYGGYVRAGEGDSTDLEGYGNQAGMQIASGSTLNSSAYSYYGEINVFTGEENGNRTHIDARGVGRINNGNSQVLMGGALTTNTSALWGVRLRASTATTSMDYAVYGVVQ